MRWLFALQSDLGFFWGVQIFKNVDCHWRGSLHAHTHVHSCIYVCECDFPFKPLEYAFSYGRKNKAQQMLPILVDVPDTI